MKEFDKPDFTAISDKEFVAEVEAHEFYVSLIMSLTCAFDRVRKYKIENDLSLQEELGEYLTSNEIAFISRVLKCRGVEVEGEEVV